MCVVVLHVVFFVKQKTAYEMRISDWSSDVCSSDLVFQMHQEHPSVGAVGKPLLRPELRIALQKLAERQTLTAGIVRVEAVPVVHHHDGVFHGDRKSVV